MKNTLLHSSLILFITSFLCSIISGCSNGQDIKRSEYAGIWYNLEQDFYMDISINGDVYLYRCSVNNGYVTNGKVFGNINGSELTEYYVRGAAGNDIDPIENVTNGFVIFDDRSTLLLERAIDIPDICFSDAVEITSFFPETATEGELTTFVVNFDYRLTSSNHATIYIASTVRQYGALFSSRVEDRVEVFSEGLGVGTLTSDRMPRIFEDGHPYELHVQMYEDKPEESLFRQLSSDFVIITVY